MKIEEFLIQNYNYNPDAKNAMKSFINQWDSWYVGNVKNFHNYYRYNGIADVPCERYTMNMAKEISEDWSDILWSEKCKISLKDENQQKLFDILSDDIDLDVVINQSIEKSGALGTCANVVSVYDINASKDGMTLDVSDSKIRIDVVDVEDIYPISWTSKDITECAFGSSVYLQGKKHIILSIHKIAADGNYHIYNHLFKESNGSIIEIKTPEGTITDFNTKSNVKWFSIHKPLLTNNLFKNNPFGIPHYANAIDNLKAVDIAFDVLKNELEEGQRITFVRADMLTYEDGTEKKVFKNNEKRLYILPKGAGKDDLIQNESVDLRTDKQIETLNTNLNILGNKVGFGENHYHFDGTNLSTATAVISSNSKMFRRKKKLEIGYEKSIRELVEAICYAATQFGVYNFNTEDMVITFDDSIIEDKEAESNRALRESNAGLISREEYREKIFGETPEIAKQKIEEIKRNYPTISELVGE